MGWCAMVQGGCVCQGFRVSVLGDRMGRVGCR